METITQYREADDVTKIPVILLKFGELENLQKLIAGSFYASSIQTIRQAEAEEEDEILRNDPAEGAHRYVSTGPAMATFSILKNPKGGPLTIPLVNMNYYEKQEVMPGNINCFYGITTDCFENNQLLPIDNRMKKFGDYFILIHNHDTFIERVKVGIRNSDRTPWRYGYVKYFDENKYNGDVHLYRKRSRYSFQKEFRIHVQTTDTIPYTVNIGDLSDIAGIYPSSVLEIMKITMNLSGSSVDISFQ